MHMTYDQVVRMMRSRYQVILRRRSLSAYSTEYQVNLEHLPGKEHAYFTEALDDAIETGKRMHEEFVDTSYTVNNDGCGGY